MTLQSPSVPHQYSFGIPVPPCNNWYTFASYSSWLRFSSGAS